jgi:hypothetical protein
MLTKNQKILAAVLTTALLGGTVGAFIAHSPKVNNNQPAAVENANAPTVNDPAAVGATVADVNDTATNQRLAPRPVSNDPMQQTAYRDGFADGYQAAQQRSATARESVTTTRVNETTAPRVVERTRYVESPRYYETRRPSFWQRHRDILTVAAGTGVGAAIGGIIGHGKGAAIGALAGAGGSALYTYKLRKRHPRY